jgi:alpha-beta hydrolase superfamily lysophospholipase
MTLILARAISLRDGPPLDWWHTEVIAAEFQVADENAVTSLEQYLEREEQVFSQLQAMVETHAGQDPRQQLNRYVKDNHSYPEKAGVNLNRSAVLQPASIRGGVLLLHGMELDRLSWQDWYEPVRFAAKHVTEQIENDQPFYLVGYSNGGALALKYSMDSLDDDGTRTPDHVFLLSPMIGVDPLARFSQLFNWVGYFDYFRQSRWLETYPEYDPHKYNSFPLHAALQSYLLTTAVKEQLQRVEKNGRLQQMPPFLTFQSLVDKTVVTSAIWETLYEKVPDNGSELVIFDANRLGVLDEFVLPRHKILLNRIMNESSGNYAVSVITNRAADERKVLELKQRSGVPGFTGQPLEYAWPDDVYSLSHVALPFPIDDPVYGLAPDEQGGAYPQIGKVFMVGEAGALILPATLSQRLRSNPFYGYMEDRLKAAVNKAR